MLNKRRNSSQASEQERQPESSLRCALRPHECSVRTRGRPRGCAQAQCDPCRLEEGLRGVRRRGVTF